MLYKTGGVDTGCCCRKQFKDDGPAGAVAYQRRLFWIAFFLMLCQTVATIAMSSFDAQFYASLPPPCPSSDPQCATAIPASDFVDRLKNVDMPLAGAQLGITLLIIYLLVILSRVTTNMVDKDDPFSNIYLIALIILFTDSQKIIFKTFDLVYMINRANSENNLIPFAQTIYKEMVITRYATVSMEMLFIIIPIRHNFLLHQVEI